MEGLGFPCSSAGKESACNVGDLCQCRGLETQVQSPGWEDPLEAGMETHSSVLAWRIPWTEGPCGLQSIGSQRAAGNWSDLAHTQGRGMVDCCKCLGVGVLCSHSCPGRSCHSIPIDLQQDKCYSLLCNFLSLYKRKSVTPLQVRAFGLCQWAILCISGYGNILNAYNRTQRLNWRKQI